MKKKKIIMSIMSLIFIVTSCKSNYKTWEFDEEVRVDYTGVNEKGDIQYLMDSKIGLRANYLGSYYYEFKMNGVSSIRKEYSPTSNYSIIEIEECIVDIYDFETNEKVKEIDIVERVEEKVDMDTYQFSETFLDGMVKKGDIYYILVTMEKIPNEEEMKEKESSEVYYCYVGINEDIVDFDEKPVQRLEFVLAYRTTIGPMKNGTFTTLNAPVDDGYNFNLAVGYNPHWYKTEEEDTIIVQIDTWRLNHLIEKEILLYEELPEIEEYIKDVDKHSLYLKLYIRGRTWEEVMALFMPIGKEITFEGIKLYDDDTKDGKERIINSYEEYMEYAKWPKMDDGFYKEIDGVE